MINKPYAWALIGFAVSILFFILHSYREGKDNTSSKHILPEEKKDHEDKYPGDSKALDKYDRLLDNMEDLTPEEEELRPDNTSDESWRLSVFFHRQNARDQNGPVKFFGKVVDQSGEPVAGADVFGFSEYYVESLSEQLHYGGGKIGTKKIQVKTDKKGLFVVDGYRATNLNFTEIKKDGYRAKDKLPTGFIFGNVFSKHYESDPASPVIFPMWKKGDTESLKKSRWRKSIIPDGRIYQFELESGRVVEEGELSVSLLADYDSIPDMNRYPWEIKISSPGGKVIESHDDFLYKAPESGYSSSLNWKFEEGKEWKRGVERSIYIKLRNEVYAAVTIDVKVYHTNKARVVVNSFINPSGSPNLEYDPVKEVKER